jgi:hypothetical protein
MEAEALDTASGLKFAEDRYDSVTGVTSYCRVFMVYSNLRAYPSYLITYNGEE